MDPRALRTSLGRLAANHRWTWTPSCRELLMSVPRASMSRHPALTVAELRPWQLDELVSDEAFVARVNQELGSLGELMSRAREPAIAYFSLEFGLTATLPLYAGGLGVLAGDHLKTSSDLGLPLVGVGLFYRRGVFQQVIENNRQKEEYRFAGPEDYGAQDTGIVVRVPLPGRHVAARVWRLDVGRTPLILLDTYVASNSETDREIADRLYIGFTNERINQEMILGVGGARALQALGWAINVYHLNEGHAGFINLELIDRVLENSDVDAAVERVRPGTIFTTHTPVPAGIDRFDRDALAPFLGRWTDRWNADFEDLWRLGQDPEDPNRFNMAGFCLRTSAAANGVSELHGEVSRRLFAGIGIGDEIGHVTNGVHARTWTAPHIQQLFDETLGPTWSNGDPQAWERVVEIDPDQVGEQRLRSSALLSHLVHSRVGRNVDPEELIIGFARRFVPYKRATLFMRHTDRLVALLNDDTRPIHFYFAGKAHPNDEHSKETVADLLRFASSPEANGRITFIPDYDMDVGHAMVKGSDIWLNNPIRPREASGTSGEKVALNGGLNCSILDGWWSEMFDGENGWEIKSSQHEDQVARDDEEAGWLLDTIEKIADEYFGDRPRFNERIIHAWHTLGANVTSARMLKQYQVDYYSPALERV